MLENRVRRTFVEGRYGQLHCRLAGAGDIAEGTVVCLHMSPKSGRTYHQLLPYLSERHLVLAPDYPGYGESDLPPAEPPVRIEDYAESVWECVEQLGAPPIHLVGYHTGSMVAVEAALQRPDWVRSVINISAPIFTASELDEAKRLYEPIPLDEAGTRFSTMWRRIMFHRGPGMTLQMAAESMAENQRSGEAYEWGHRAAFEYAPTYGERLAELTVPLLVMNPNDDCYEQTRRADPLLRNGRRVDFPDWGHGFLQAYPEQVAKVMLAFFDSVG